MARPKDIATKATRESRAKGGRARAEKVRAEREDERQLLAEARRERLGAIFERLAAAGDRAVDVIIELLDKAESETVRLRAALALFEVLQAVELGELAERLERLEDNWAERTR